MESGRTAGPAAGRRRAVRPGCQAAAPRRRKRLVCPRRRCNCPVRMFVAGTMQVVYHAGGTGAGKCAPHRTHPQCTAHRGRREGTTRCTGVAATRPERAVRAQPACLGRDAQPAGDASDPVARRLPAARWRVLGSGLPAARWRPASAPERQAPAHGRPAKRSCANKQLPCRQATAAKRKQNEWVSITTHQA
eukprot:SAG22_NODE_7474_length_736_cov_0.996860_1_plen_191_part_00